jgi:hypothetical protein
MTSFVKEADIEGKLHHVSEGSLSDIAFRLRHVCSSSRADKGTSVAKSILSTIAARRTAIGGPKQRKFTRHSHRQW